MPTVTHKTAAELLGVPDPPRNARDRLLRTAVDLFYLHGYNAVGIDRIIAGAGVTKTTFYKHFDGKDDLMVEAVRLRDRWETAAWERAVRTVAGDDPRDQLLGFFEVLDRWFNEPDFIGCAFINAAAEFPNPHDPVHEAAAAHKRATRDGFRNLAEAAGARDPEAFADQYTLLLEGTLVLRQVHGRNDAARLGLGAVQALMDHHMPVKRTAKARPRPQLKRR